MYFHAVHPGSGEPRWRCLLVRLAATKWCYASQVSWQATEATVATASDSCDGVVVAALSFGCGATCGGNGLCMRIYSKFCDFYHVFCIISYSVFFIWFSLKTIWSYLYALSLYYLAFLALISDFHIRPFYRICNVVCCYFSLLCSCFSIGMSL